MEHKDLFENWPLNWSYRKEFQDFVLKYYKLELGFKVLDEDDPELLEVIKKINGKDYQIRLVWTWSKEIGKGCWAMECDRRYPDYVFMEHQMWSSRCVRGFISCNPDCPEIKEAIKRDPEGKYSNLVQYYFKLFPNKKNKEE